MAMLYDLVWDTALFHLGRLTLLALTLGRYPRRDMAERHSDRVAGVGALVVACAWGLMALYNHVH